MEIKKILETVFIKEYNVTAHILENDIYVCLFNHVFMDRTECFEHINEYYKGWVQSTMSYRYSIKNNKRTAAVDYLSAYEKLFDELEKYAENKFKEFKKTNTTTSFNFNWYTTEEEQEKEEIY